MTKVIKTPSRWRQGQTLFNFLEWLLQHGYAPGNQNYRLADTFHIPDEKLEQYWAEFLAEHGGEDKNENNNLSN